ncbi:acyl-CoA dehydrogenase family protein [Mycolicibacterium neoaurum]|uniref:acyl-CoA dehydrogenase family protein n=1 Tax=Mycolicibacterium neoaurum TaxID=1795 RepID=UPI0026719761|nr:acyl-CoA dehydrogenase family protein [Mycolicibacterium neoaurum]MDO3402747.1 acyl-CoA dehydrogenase family protein [Mycolicibacterium neoaurum]
MSATVTAPPAAIDEARNTFREWLTANQAELEQFRVTGGDVTEIFDRLRLLQRMLFDAGWIRLGWSETVGGLGGAPILRSIVSEELAAAGYPPPFSFATQEVLGPAVAKFARPELAAVVMPRLLAGDETWCQGFSEPGAGSDLASLRLKAVEVDEGWRVTGEKVWTSWAQFADRCVLLARTGGPDSAHQGISAFLLDMDTPGIQVSPMQSMNGDEEFCSLYFDDALIPRDRLLGDVNGGWAVAMYVLAGERGAAAWQRQIWLRTRLQDLAGADGGAVGDDVIGEALELLTSLRVLSRRTVRALSDGESIGATTSLDKLAMSTAEKFLFDAALSNLGDDVVYGRGAGSVEWRNDYLYSRASSIYGGAAEIQRNIIAERLLGLPR